VQAQSVPPVVTALPHLTSNEIDGLRVPWQQMGWFGNLQSWQTIVETTRSLIGKSQSEIEATLIKLDDPLSKVIIHSLTGNPIKGIEGVRNSDDDPLTLSGATPPVSYVVGRLSALWPFRPDLAQKMLLYPSFLKPKELSIYAPEVPPIEPKDREEMGRLLDNRLKIEKALDIIRGHDFAQVIMALDIPTCQMGCNIKLNKGSLQHADPFKGEGVIYFTNLLLNNLGLSSPYDMQLLSQQIHHAIRKNLIFSILKSSPRSELDERIQIVDCLDRLSSRYSKSCLDLLKNSYNLIVDRIEMFKTFDKELRSGELKKNLQDLLEHDIPAIQARIVPTPRGLAQQEITDPNQSTWIELIGELEKAILLKERVGDSEGARDLHLKVIDCLIELQRSDPRATSPILAQAKKVSAYLWHGDYKKFLSGLNALLFTTFEDIKPSEAGFPVETEADTRWFFVERLNYLIKSLPTRYVMELQSRGLRASPKDKEMLSQTLNRVDSMFASALQRLDLYNSLLENMGVSSARRYEHVFRESRFSVNVISRDPRLVDLRIDLYPTKDLPASKQGRISNTPSSNLILEHGNSLRLIRGISNSPEEQDLLDEFVTEKISSL